MRFVFVGLSCLRVCWLVSVSCVGGNMDFDEFLHKELKEHPWHYFALMWACVLFVCLFLGYGL